MKWLTQLYVFLVVALMRVSAFAAPAVTNLPDNRILLFNDYVLTNAPNVVWVHEGALPGSSQQPKRALLPGTNHFHSTGWRLLSCRSGSAAYLTGAFTVPPKLPATVPTYPAVATNLAANLRYEIGAVLESPVLTNGLGTLYFEAINNQIDYPAVLAVEVATNMVEDGTGTVIPTVLPPSTNNLSYVWEPLGSELTLAAVTSNEFTRVNRLLNFRGPLKLRIRRTGSLTPGVTDRDTNFATVDNIRVSPPPSDVKVYNLSAFNNGGNFTIRGFVDNADTNAPTDSRTVTAYYRWLPDTVWSNAPMSLTAAGDGAGNGEQYDFVLPTRIEGGDLVYYVACGFSGYVYQSPDYTGQGYTGYPSEALSPFTTSVQTQHLAGADLYTLTVNGGSGSGPYTNGQPVSISASNVVGKSFHRWTGATQYVADVTAPTTTVTMPSSDISVTATYTNNFYTLTVNGGSGSGPYEYEAQVPIVADEPLPGKIFLRWTGDTASVLSVTSAATTVSMPAAPVTLTATYVDVFALTVNSGSGDGSYTNGQVVAISADAPLPGKIFLRWTGDTASVASVTSAVTTVTMPAAPVTLTATYVDVFALTVNNGSGDGSYTNGHVVVITADAPLPGKIFYRWTGDTATVANIAAASTTVTMPGAPVTLTATYLDIYTLTVNGGSGSGSSYTNGQRVAITANAPALGKAFAGWTGSTQYVDDAAASSTTVTMPPLSIALTATYSNLYYTLTVNGGSGSGAYTNGQKVTITANVPVEKTFDRWSGDTAYVTPSVTSATATVTMPALAITLSALFSSQTSTLPNNRFLHFNDYTQTNAPNAIWEHFGPLPGSSQQPTRALLPGTNHLHSTGWRLFSCRTGSSAYLSGSNFIPPKDPATVPTYPAVASNLAANLRYELGAMIESPVFTNGAGTLYFDVVTNDAAYPAELTIQIATNMVDVNMGTNCPTLLPPSTNNFDYVWETLDVPDLAVTPGYSFKRYSRLVNYRGPIIFRIRRTGTLNPGLSNRDSAFVVIDNIQVSLPPSDVVVTKTSAPFEPGFPSVATNLKVRCWVSNADTNAPTDSRTPKVVYRWRFLNQVIQPWRTNTMSYVMGTGDGQGNNEVYEADLSLSPFTEVGDLEYYYICDFGGYVYLPPDYTGLNYTGYPSENLSPRFYRYESGGGEFTVRLRPYASRYGKLQVVAATNQFATPIDMVLVGDNEWRGMVPIAGTGITNLIWRFRAEGEYEPDSGVISEGTSYWAGVSSVAGGRMPYGGLCVETNENGGSLSVLVDEGNYVLLTFNVETLQYSATRGEYQSFNQWPAPEYYFSESNGQDPKSSSLNTFDDWPVNQPRVYMQAFAGYPSSTNTYTRDPFFTLAPECVAGSAAYVSERTVVDFTINAPTSTVPIKFRNVAMRLKGGDGSLGLGYIYNRVATLPDGLKEVTFKARLGQTSDNHDVSFYRYGFTNFNYLVRGNLRAVGSIGLSPQNPSLSLIGYYTDPDNFYEYRVTQVNDTRDSAGAPIDKTIRHELYRWVGGVATLIGTPQTQTTSTSPLVDGADYEMRFYNEATGTQIKCKFATADNISFLDTSSSRHTFGTFGYLSSECWSGLSNVRGRGTLTGAAENTGSAEVPYLRTDNINFPSDVANWYLPAGRYVANPDVSPKSIYSVIPSLQIGIYTQPTMFESDVEPEGVGSLNWNLLTTIPVTNFSYQSVSIPVNSWQSQFVMLQVLGGNADVAIDEFSVSSWHGRENGDDTAQGFPSEWYSTESWVVSNASVQLHTVYLDHSRADPDLDQVIRSKYSSTGLGLMEFDCRVLRAVPTKLTVQYALKQQPNDTDWKDLESFVITNSYAGWRHLSSYFGTNAPGYFRLLNEREGIFTNAWVEIDNATIWDEPTVTNNSWRAYNAKITAVDSNRVALSETAACFLNNDKYLETDPPQTQFEPYLRSPELPNGLGKLTFYARAYTNNQAATLFLYATTNGWNAPTNQWFEIRRFENITNGLYQLFTYEPEDGRAFNAIKLGTKTSSGERRVCLEDVTISEPVFPGFSIVNVQLMEITSGEVYEPYAQPLEGEEVHVQAEIDNIQMAPSNVVMYVSYYIGTNRWGIGNWPAGEVVTRRMTNNVPDRPTLYRTVPAGTPGFSVGETGGIPGQDRNQVVQYYVWAEFDGGIHLRTQQETFVNPSWYYPVDMNVRYAPSWSPYYFVYEVPPNAVWINELNATDYIVVNGVEQLGIWNNVYIEIAMPVWLDLAGWSVEVVKNDYSVQQITIPSGLPEQTVSSNNFAFFVIGDAAPPPPGVPSLPKVDYAYPGLKSILPYFVPGGLRLKRPLGMYEQSSAYDFTNSWGGMFSGTNWAAKDPKKDFMYVGMENYGGSLGVTNGAGLSFSDWTFPMAWTPGWANAGQNLQDGNSFLPGVSNIVITSLMNLDKATQNGKRITYYTLKMRKGQSTNIVYQTDPWYRLFSVNKDSVEQLPSLGTQTNYNLMLPLMQSDVNVNVDVRLRQDLTDQNLDPDVLNWILGFEDGELIPMYYQDRLLTLTEQYWLDANPTRTNTFELAITRFELDPETNFHVTVMSALNTNKMTYLQGEAVLKLQAKSRLFDTDWEMLAQYTLTADSFDASNTCRVFVQNPFALVLQGADPKTLFFRWLIELKDPRVASPPLAADLD